MLLHKRLPDVLNSQKKNLTCGVFRSFDFRGRRSDSVANNDETMSIQTMDNSPFQSRQNQDVRQPQVHCQILPITPLKINMSPEKGPC